MPISYSNPIDRLPKCENDDVWLFFCQRGYDGRSIVRMRTCTLKHNQTKSDSAVPAGLSICGDEVSGDEVSGGGDGSNGSGGVYGCGGGSDEDGGSDGGRGESDTMIMIRFCMRMNTLNIDHCLHLA